MKLPIVVFSALVAIAAAKSVKFNEDIAVEDNSAYGYLARIGLPLANMIREAEELSTNTNTTIKPVMLAEGPEEPIVKIVRGNPARLGDAPYQAGLLASFSAGESVCGGSLISTNRVVTAAHCWWDGKNQAHSITVVLGSLKLYSGGTRLKSSKVVMHSQWNPQVIRNDIALIYLPQAVQTSNIIKPISLPSGAMVQESFVGETVLASGFGRTHDYDPLSHHTVLSLANLKVVSNGQCSLMYGQLGSSVICALGDNYRSTCQGDSGGPLAITKDNKPILVGITSFGPWSCETGSPTGFTRVTTFVDWIKKQL